MKNKNIIISVIIFILCLLGSYKLIIPSRCYGMGDGLWIIFISIILLILIAIVFILDIYRKIKFNRQINLLPYLTLIITVSLLMIILYFKSEKFKSNRVLVGRNSYRELILRKNENYELIDKLPEIGCTETGKYKISNDTIYLTEEPEFDQTLYIDEKFLIDKNNGLLIPIIKDTLSTNSEDNLIIENKYVP